MEIMEKLYNRGYLSYPRTETNKYVKSINLRELTERMVKCELLGKYAQEIVQGDKWGGPRNGISDDKSHPPIHPVKPAKRSDLDS